MSRWSSDDETYNRQMSEREEALARQAAYLEWFNAQTAREQAEWEAAQEAAWRAATTAQQDEADNTGPWWKLW